MTIGPVCSGVTIGPVCNGDSGDVQRWSWRNWRSGRGSRCDYCQEVDGDTGSGSGVGDSGETSEGGSVCGGGVAFRVVDDSGDVCGGAGKSEDDVVDDDDAEDSRDVVLGGRR